MVTPAYIYKPEVPGVYKSMAPGYNYTVILVILWCLVNLFLISR